MHRLQGDADGDVVNIGIGVRSRSKMMGCFTRHQSSDVGYSLCFQPRRRPDGAVVANSDPRTTLFIVVSKTFTTQGTLFNARTAQLAPRQSRRRWCCKTILQPCRASRNAPSVRGESIVFPIWDWVGGVTPVVGGRSDPDDRHWSHAFAGMLQGTQSGWIKHFGAVRAQSAGDDGAGGALDTSFLKGRNLAVLPYQQSRSSTSVISCNNSRWKATEIGDFDGLSLVASVSPIVWGTRQQWPTRILPIAAPGDD